MARSEVTTLLPLDSWAQIMGVSPWEFNQVSEGFPTTNNAQCPFVWFQYPWQQDFLSREEIGRAVEKAEEMIAEELHFWPAPKYFVDEMHRYPRPHNRELWGDGGTPRGQWKAVQLDWGKIQVGGILARTSIAAAAVTVLTDNDGDGVNDRFTVTVATTVTDPNEIAIYITTADRNGAPLDETWRLRPINVSITGGNAIITGHPSLLVSPDKMSVVNPQPLDVTVAANFVTSVDVFRVYTDTSTTTANPFQGRAQWEDPNCTTPPCAVVWVPLCLGARNPIQGQVSVDYWLAGVNSIPVAREPDNVVVNYLAGEPLVGGKMSQVMADVVAHLATGILPIGPCGCERSDRIINWWRSMPTAGIPDERQLTQAEIDYCPFGQSRGALYAWSRVKNLQQVWAVLS